MPQMTPDSSRMIYLDHNATTPLAPEVVEAMRDHLTVFGNPSSLYKAGRDAHQLVETAREQVAELLNVSHDTITFTGSGSEANNMAIKGLVLRHQPDACHLITSQIEHSAVLATCRFLEQLGYAVTYLPVGSEGRVDPDAVRQNLRPTTRLISVMHANNETGVMQPIEEIGVIAREAGVVFHCDAIQTVGKLPVDLSSLPVDLLSLTAHKFYGPKGVGALVIREGVEVHPLIHGGSQEHGRRAGTENVLGIIGIGVASDLAFETALAEEAQQAQRVLRDRLCEGLIGLGDVTVNGNLQHVLPGTLNVSFRYIKGDALATALAFEHIAVSTGSACHAHEARPSHVLQAMGLTDQWISGAIRFSLGRSTTMAQIDHVLEVITRTLSRLRRMSPLVHAA